MAIQLTAQEKIQNIISQIVHLIEDSNFDGIEGKELIACLGSAIEELNKGKINTAADILEASVKKIEAEVIAGNLTPAAGVVLVKAALNVLMD